jgi:hypothetical protein
MGGRLQLPREWIGLALVILGLARAALLVAHDPLVGYGSGEDMVRSGACLGLFPDLPEPARLQAHPEAPIPDYKVQDVRRELCYPSTEIAIDAATLSITRATGLGKEIVRLQWVGFVKLALLAITALVLAWAFHPHPGAALFHGVVVFVLLSDSIATLWYNTLYTEFAVIWALYAAISAIAALAITERRAIPLTAVLVTALGALAFSREQFALLAPLIVLVSWPWLWQRSPHLTVAAFGVALIAATVNFELVPRPAEVKQADRADTYLGVVLPAVSDTKAAMTQLGLPEQCEPMIGATWSRQRGDSIATVCPEALKLSSIDYLRMGRLEPAALGRAASRVLPATQEMTPPDVGTLAGGKDVPINGLPWWLRSPVHAIAWRLPLFVYVSMVIATALAAPIALLGALGWARPSRTQHGVQLLLAMLFGGIVIYAFITTAFGDGLHEASRHFLPGSLAMWAAWIGFVFAVPSLVLRWIEAPKERMFEMVAAVLGVAALAVGTSYAIGWGRVQPLAIGVLDEPAGRQVAPGAALKVRGWAIDPAGVESVTVVLGKIERAATLGQATDRAKRTFPSYPHADVAGFATEFTAAEIGQAGSADPVAMRVLVKSRAGPTMEIDRRRLVIPQLVFSQ